MDALRHRASQQGPHRRAQIGEGANVALWLGEREGTPEVRERPGLIARCLSRQCPHGEHPDRAPHASRRLSVLQQPVQWLESIFGLTSCDEHPRPH